MNIIFIEYRISIAHRDIYLERIPQLLQPYSHVSLYEGIDQPNVFVEQWLDTTNEDYINMKEMRCEQVSKWDVITAYILGGKKAINIWQFRLRAH